MTIQTLETIPTNPVSNAGCDLPPAWEPKSFSNAAEAVEALRALYERNTAFLRDKFEALGRGDEIPGRVRAFYPQIEVETESYSHVDSRLAYGHVVAPGRYTATVTRPDLFGHYLETQIGLMMRNHEVAVTISESETPIPVHFAFLEGTYVEQTAAGNLQRPLRDTFDVPDLNTTNDDIANGDFEPVPANRYRWRFHRAARRLFAASPRPLHGDEPGALPELRAVHELPVLHGRVLPVCPRRDRQGRRRLHGIRRARQSGHAGRRDRAGRPACTPRLPQMPAYHLKKDDRTGITMVNIGVGPSNAKTITDHIAVLRPHAWLMLGHCAGLRNSQALGDYVLAHAYVREDNVLNEDIPLSVPVPPLAEVQVALEDAVEEVTGLSGYELKKVMRTGTVATIDNRNWELRDQRGPVRRLSQSRAIALDMESATIAANGFRFRVPYGTLLCVSDKPLHGELKLPGMATDFYKRQVAQHLIIGIKAMERLAQMPPERLHSAQINRGALATRRRSISVVHRKEVSEPHRFRIAACDQAQRHLTSFIYNYEEIAVLCTDGFGFLLLFTIFLA
jgi:AMP nucleosidase